MPAERTTKDAYPEYRRWTKSRGLRGRAQPIWNRSSISTPKESDNDEQKTSLNLFENRQRAYPPTQWRYPPLPLDLPGPGLSRLSNSPSNRSISPASPVLSPDSLRSNSMHSYRVLSLMNEPLDARRMRCSDRAVPARTTEGHFAWTSSVPTSSASSVIDAYAPALARNHSPFVHNQNQQRRAPAVQRDNMTSSSAASGSLPSPEPPYLPDHNWRHPNHNPKEFYSPMKVVNTTYPAIVSPPQGAFIDPFELLENANFLDIDQPDPKGHPDLGSFFMYSDSDKHMVANDIAREFDEFCKFKKAMQPSARFLIRMEATVFGRAIFHSKEAALHILTTSENLIMCPYHADIVKNYKIKGNLHSRIQPDPKAPRKPGFLHCGCPEDDVMLEMMLRKVTSFESPETGQSETMRTEFLDPRERAFFCTVFRRWTGLTSDDLFRFTEGGRMRTYEDILRQQILQSQAKLEWLETTRRQAWSERGVII